ncbi:MAG: acetate kinase [Lachnospiraceae bacterium]|jgi:acetate kinase|nr:acetate kinase [Lachnospiraceae bacterium]
MNILVINCGSSSLKFQLIDSVTEETITKGICERIGIPGSQIVYQALGKEKIISEIPMEDHLVAVKIALAALTDPVNGVISSLAEIGAVGHRLVHGGEKFNCSVLITDEVIAATTECNDLAPLHNPANLIGVAACRELMPNTPMVGVFDTAFHQTMPEKAYIYGIPYEYYERYKVRRYGFHGTSHAYVSQRAAEIFQEKVDKTRNLGNLKTIVCHLGNGASASAVLNGKSVDTSMGLTPLEGLIMGTRSGDIDPAIIEFVASRENLTLHEVGEVLNKKSGMAGLQRGGSSDFRDIVDDYLAGKPEAVRAIEAYVYRVAKYIGAYAAAMNGVDIICFTAGIGENNGVVRAAIMEYLGYLGINVASEINQKGSGEMIISTPESRVCVMVIPTDEELMIARDTKLLAENP